MKQQVLQQKWLRIHLHPNIDVRVLAEEEKGAGWGRHVEEGGEEEEKDEMECSKA